MNSCLIFILPFSLDLDGASTTSLHLNLEDRSGPVAWQPALLARPGQQRGAARGAMLQLATHHAECCRILLPRFLRSLSAVVRLGLAVVEPTRLVWPLQFVVCVGKTVSVGGES